MAMLRSQLEICFSVDKTPLLHPLLKFLPTTPPLLIACPSHLPISHICSHQPEADRCVSCQQQEQQQQRQQQQHQHHHHQSSKNNNSNDSNKSTSTIITTAATRCFLLKMRSVQKAVISCSSSHCS